MYYRCHHCIKLSVFKCYECNVFLCPGCCKKHTKEPKKSNHAIQPIRDRYMMNYKFVPFEKTTWIRDITSLKNGLLVILTDAEKNAVTTCSVKGASKHRIPVEETPHRTAVVDLDTVAVLCCRTKDDHIIPYTFIVTIVDTLQRYIVQRISSESKFNVIPALIFIENQFYLTTDSDMIVMDMQGIIKRGIKPMFKSYDVCNDAGTRQIICIDRQKSELNCIDEEGNIQFAFTDREMKDPCGLTLDDESNVLVLCKIKNKNLFYVIKVDSEKRSSEIVITNIKNNRHPHICFNCPTKSIIVGCGESVYMYKKA